MKKSPSSVSFFRITLLSGLVAAAFVSQAIAGPGVDYWLNQGKAKKSTTTACVKTDKDSKQQASATSDSQTESTQNSATTGTAKTGAAVGAVKQR